MSTAQGPQPGGSMSEHPHPGDELPRGIGMLQATSLNVANMVGVGPFITIPLFINTMRGPQAMLGWVLGAVLVLCDGLVWSELRQQRQHQAAVARITSCAKSMAATGAGG